MKKIICVFLCLLTAMCCVFAVAVDKTTYYIPEGDVSIDIPNDYYVVYRDMKDDNPVLKELNFSKEDVIKVLDEHEYYLDAFDLTFDFDLSVSLTKMGASEDDINSISDAEVLSLYDIDTLNSVSSNLQFSKVDIYKTETLKFVKAEATEYLDGLDNRIIEYLTSNNNYIIVIGIYLSEESLSSDLENDLQKIVDSMVIGNKLTCESSVTNQSIITYSYNDSTTPSTDSRYLTGGKNVIFCVLIAVCIGVISFLFVRKKKDERTLPGKESADISIVNDAPPHNNVEQQRLFCYNCGSPLRPDSKYCEECGVRVETITNQKNKN